MNGRILSDCGSVCSCGGLFKSKKDLIIKIEYPACQSCGLPPSKLRVRKSFPNRDGSIYKKDFHSYEGKGLRSVGDCLELIGQLNQEIHGGEFKIERYNAKAREQMSFANVAKKYLEYNEARALLPQAHDNYISPGGLRVIKTNLNSHLLPYFSFKNTNQEKKETLYIDEIGKFEIKQFHNSYTEHFRARDKALGELKTLLYFAKNELEYIKEVPKFPEIKQAKSLRAEEIPDLDVQVKIISAIDNELYRDMWILTASIACRPSEIRALHVGDVDFFKEKITIQRHFSEGGKGSDKLPIPGRKSIKANEELGIITHKLDAFLMTMLFKYTANRNSDEPLFKSTNGYVSATSFRDSWNKARKKVGEKVTGYVGTKHASLSEFVTRTGDWNKAIKFSKHKDEKSLKRYAQDKSEDFDFVNSDRFSLVGNGGQVVGDVFNGDVISRNH